MADPVTIGLAVGGTLLQAYGQYQAGEAAQQAARAEQQQLDAQARQMRINAGQERASAQRKMIETSRQKRLMQSKAIAMNAAGGGDTMDAGVIDILGDLEAEGSYNANVALYEGEDRARDLEYGANLKNYEGEMARMGGKMEKQAANIRAVSTLVKGSSSMADKYGDSSSNIAWNGPRYTDNPSYYKNYG